MEAAKFNEWSIKKHLANALEDMKLEYPTSIQRKSFAPILSGNDVCGIAQTGTGKTLAYLLPLLQSYAFSPEKIPFCLILVPTRELVAQVLETLTALSQYMTLRAVGVYGGANMKINVADLKEGANIVVGTPGRIIDLLANGTLKPKSVRKIVIDEFDEMLELGFRAQINQVLEKLPEKLQYILYSATQSTESEQFITKNFKKTEIIEAAQAGQPLENISQKIVPIKNFYSKINFLREWVLQHELEKVLIFCSSKKVADLIYEELEEILGDQLGVIHGNKAQNYRFNTLSDFENGNIKFLLATDLLARGIDVQNVSHVINMDVPIEPQNYIHRIGRTGRQGKKGYACTLVSPKELDYLQTIEKFIGQAIENENVDFTYKESELVAEFENEEVIHKTIKPKIRLKEDFGGAFHEKSAKNSQVNVRRNHVQEKLYKYGKAIKKTRRND